MELTKYSWWGESNEPPEHLKTKKQLGELGRSPLNPSGIIETGKYDVLLYDIHNPECCRPKRKPSLKQWETLAANRLKAKIKRDYQEWYRQVGFIGRVFQDSKTFLLASCPLLPNTLLGDNNCLTVS